MDSSASGTGTTITTTSAVPNGNSIILSVLLGATSSQTGAVTVSDSAHNTYVVDQDTNDGTAGDRYLVISSLHNAGLPMGGTITLSFPSSGTYQVSVDQFSGVTARDRHTGASGTTTTFSSGSAKPITATPELLYGGVGIEAGTTGPTFGGGWTPITFQQLGTSTDYQGSAYRIVSSTGKYSFTGTSGGTWMAEIVTYH